MSRLYRRRWLWSAFVFLVALALGAMIVLSITAWRLDALETEARHAAAVEENLRLALWRIDAAWAPLIAHENVRRPGDTSNVAWDRRAIVGRVAWSPETGLIGAEPLGERVAAIDFDVLWHQLSPASPGQDGLVDAWIEDESLAGRSLPVVGSADFQQRNQAISINNFLAQQISNHSMSAAGHNPAAPLKALWDAGQMLLVRRSQSHRGEVLEATLLDWQQLRFESLRMIADLLPHASLQPIEGAAPERSPDMLATLPVRLIPGTLPIAESPRRFSVAVTLAAAWTGVLLASVLGAVLLHGVLQLSERRAAFVTAVTHELRTPLTTFQLYTEMLCSGMISTDADRRNYLQTLRSEALRLNHLVDNVLAYARLERGRSVGAMEVLSVGELLNRVQPRLEQLAVRNEMQLAIEESEAWAAWVQVNVSVVEQVLLNLVDNACKYADGAERRIEVSTASRTEGVELRVRDYGPGLPASVGWPRPFSKSAHQAAESSPGVGLGLALSRRLARQLGGSLRSEPPVGGRGACLVLTLSRSSAAVKTPGVAQ